MGHNERFTCFVEKRKTIIFEKYFGNESDFYDN